MGIPRIALFRQEYVSTGERRGDGNDVRIEINY